VSLSLCVTSSSLLIPNTPYIFLCLSVSVLAKQVVPTVGYADEDVFLPQWAIAGIVIGLASLLFVIIFGVTVVSNKLLYYCVHTDN